MATRQGGLRTALRPGTRLRRTPSSTKSAAKKVKKRNPWSDDESKSESDLEENEPVIIPRDSLLRRAAAERPKYTFDFSEEEDAAAEDTNNNNNLDEVKKNINDREDDYVPSDSLEKDDYDFSPIKSKPSPEVVSQVKTSQDFGNLFTFSSYSRKANIDTSKFDSAEEDSTPIDSSFISKETEKLSSKQVVTKKGKGRGAKKRKASGSHNEGEYNPGRSKKVKKTAFNQDSDVDIFPSDFASETTARPRTGRARKEVKYFVESDEDDDFAMF